MDFWKPVISELWSQSMHLADFGALDSFKIIFLLRSSRVYELLSNYRKSSYGSYNLFIFSCPRHQNLTYSLSCTCLLFTSIILYQFYSFTLPQSLFFISPFLHIFSPFFHRITACFLTISPLSSSCLLPCSFKLYLCLLLLHTHHLFHIFDSFSRIF